MSINEGRAKTRLLNIYHEHTETRNELVPRIEIEQLMTDIKAALDKVTCDNCVDFNGTQCILERPVEAPQCNLWTIINEWFLWYDDTRIRMP